MTTSEVTREAMLIKAIEIAVKAHGTTINKDGTLYLLHPLRLMMKAENTINKIIAVLHDVVEDTNVTIDDLHEWLSDLGLDRDVVIGSLRLLTHNHDDSYEEYINKIVTSSYQYHCHAVAVKLLDLYDNIDLTRLPEISEYDLQRALRYHKAMRILENEMERYNE